MIVVAVRLAWPYLLTPWRSPLLRWRLETFGVCDAHGTLLCASSITPAVFVRFLLTHWIALLGFLRWASSLPSQRGGTLHEPPAWTEG